MNERIRELAEQAGFKSAGELFGQSVPEYAIPLEKFAELLIRDVTETAAKFRQSKTRPVGWNFRATVLNEYGLKEND